MGNTCCHLVFCVLTFCVIRRLPLRNVTNLRHFCSFEISSDFVINGLPGCTRKIDFVFRHWWRLIRFIKREWF